MTAVTVAPGSDIGSGQTGAGFCRIQIAAPTTRVDLAVPTAVPLAALLPGIVSFAEQDWAAQQDGAAPHGWALSRLDGARLDPAAGLAVAGVREGELLLLHPAHETVGEPLYDDVVEVLGKGSADTGWSARDTRVAGAVLGTLAVLGAVWSAVTVGSPLAGILLGVLTLLLLGGGAALAHAAGDVPAGTLLGALAAVTGAAFGVVLLGPPVGAAHVVVAAAVVVLVAATGPALVDGGDAVFLGLGLTALLALLGGALVLLTGATPARAAAVAAPLALALTTVTPTLALRLSRIPRPPLPRTAADLADVPGQLELDRVLDRVRRARALLSGLVAGCYAAAALGVVTLTTDTRRPVACRPRGRPDRAPAAARAVVPAPRAGRRPAGRRRRDPRGRGGGRHRERGGRGRAPGGGAAGRAGARRRGVRGRRCAAGGAHRAPGCRAVSTCWRRCCCSPSCRSRWRCGTSTRGCWRSGREGSAVRRPSSPWSWR